MKLKKWDLIIIYTKPLILKVDGTYYEGNFLDAKPHGKCFMLRPDKSRYDG